MLAEEPQPRLLLGGRPGPRERARQPRDFPREGAEEADSVWLTASLSRISRHLGKLLRAVEYLLAHDVPILTANYLLRTHDVWVRRGELAPVDHKDPLAAWRVSRGLSGAHRATVPKVVEQLEAEEQNTEA